MKDENNSADKRITRNWAPVAHTYHPSYLGDRSGGLQFKVSPDKYFMKPPSPK
jgi:hypothetical protein